MKLFMPNKVIINISTVSYLNYITASYIDINPECAFLLNQTILLDVLVLHKGLLMLRIKLYIFQ